MSAHSSRLQHALKDLREKWDITSESWADQVAQDFGKKPPRLDRVPGQAHDRGNGQAFRIAGEDSSPVPGE